MKKAIILFVASLLAAPFFHAAESASEPGPARSEAREAVYEGRSAADWGKDLRAAQNTEKAAHALLKLGKDAVPVLTQMLKEHDPRISASASNILAAMKHNKDAVSVFTLLLKDSDFEVRRNAVKVLGEFVRKDAAAKAALQEALKDRDKAVVEAAERELDMLVDQNPRIEMLLKQASVALQQSQFDRASALANDALALDPQNAQAQKLASLARARSNQNEEMPFARGDETKRQIDGLVKAALEALQKNDLERTAQLANKIAAIDPNNEQARRLLDYIRKDPAERRRAGGKPPGSGEARD